MARQKTDINRCCLVSFDSATWQSYSLQELAKVPSQPHTTLDVNEENEIFFSFDDDIKIKFIEKIAIQAYFYCDVINKNLVEYVRDFEEQLSASCATRELKSTILPKKKKDTNIKCQEYSSIKSFNDINFINNMCYIMSEDVLQVLDIINIIMKEKS